MTSNYNYKTLVIMNAETNLEAYEAPKCEIIEMQQEGVLCGSSVHDPYFEDDFIW